MDKFVTDQAEGLRRLLTPRPLRLVAVLGAAPGAGATTVAHNLAAALRFHGKRALVIDERPGGAAHRYSMSALIDGRIAAEDLMAACDDDSQQSVPMIGAYAGDLPYGAAQQIAALDGQVDVAFIDAVIEETGELSPLAARAHDVLVVLDTQADAMPAVYSLLKRVHFAHGIQQFRLLFNRVGVPADAQNLFHQLSGVVTRYLGVALTPAGVISRDPERLARAQALGGCVVRAFPSAPAAVDFRRIGAEVLHWPWRPIVTTKAVTPSYFDKAGEKPDQNAVHGAERRKMAGAAAAVTATAAVPVTTGGMNDKVAERGMQQARADAMSTERQAVQGGTAGVTAGVPARFGIGPQALASAALRQNTPAHTA